MTHVRELVNSQKKEIYMRPEQTKLVVVRRFLKGKKEGLRSICRKGV